MTAEAKGAEIIEIAFTAAFGDGNDVIGVPQGLT
jgi:hypothetical protein